MNLSPQEIARYQRHLSLPGFGADGQLALKKARVLLIGVGGLGCPALLYLAAAGVGRITIIDPDRVDLSNLQRQVLFTTEDLGEFKVEAAARRIRALNPLIEITARAERFNRDNALALVGEADVVVDGSDNFATRYLVNDACVIGQRPFVYGAIQGFEGQVSVFNWQGGPTYRCLFPEPPEPGTVPNCAEGGVLGVLPGLIGTAQACEAIKMLSGIGEPLSGKLLIWNALNMRSQIVKIPVDSRSHEIRSLPPAGFGETCSVQIPDGLEIDANALRQLLQTVAPKKVQLLDVREGWERDLGAIAPSAHIALGELSKSSKFEVLPQWNPAAPTVVYCASGRRSLTGAALLRENFGFANVRSLRGGYKGWLGSIAVAAEGLTR